MSPTFSYDPLHSSSVSCPKSLDGRYAQAMKTLKDSTNQKAYLTMEGDSKAPDITKQLPSAQNIAKVSYVKQGQSYHHVIISRDTSSE